MGAQKDFKQKEVGIPRDTKPPIPSNSHMETRGRKITIIGGYPLVMTNIANWKDPPSIVGKSTISMVIFNSYVKLPEGT